MARRIGVEVTTSTRGGPTNPGGPAGAFHIAGITERGPVGAPVAVGSIGEYERRLGRRTPYSGAAYDAARLFFGEGGTELLVSRVVGASAESASAELLAPGEEGTGEAVARVDLVEAGGFGNGHIVTVAQADQAYTVTVTDVEGEVVAVFRNVTTLDGLVAAARSNTQVTISSLTEQDELTLATDTYDMAGGSDDRETVTADDVVAALDAGGDEGEGAAVAAPGYPADVIGEQLIAHASQNRKIALLAAHAEASISEMESLAEQLQGDTSGEYAGLFYPHVSIPDASGARVVSPEAMVAGARARTFATGNYWMMPAGTDRGLAQFANGSTPALSRADVERLDVAHVSGIETSGSRLYLNNWASLATDRENLGKLRDADVLNNLAVQIEGALEQYVWEDIDSRGHLHSDIDSTVTAIVAGIADAGGLYAATNDAGEATDPGYLVSVNPDPGLAADDRVEVSASIRLAGTAKLISVGLIKVAIGGNL